jgi:hypothetical protein
MSSEAKFTNIFAVKPIGMPIQQNKGLFKEMLEYKLISPGAPQLYYVMRTYLEPIKLHFCLS